MVTKITVELPQAIPMLREKNEREYGINDFGDKHFVREIGEHLIKLSYLVGYLEENPSEDIQKAIHLHIPKASINVRNITKKKRVHRIWLCYIHEEDL